MCNRLENRAAVVTGAARGMGFAIAKALFEEGAKVAIVDIAAETVKEAARRLDPKNERSMAAVVDVTRKNEVQDFIKMMNACWKRVDILVNNAGGALHTPHRLEEIEEKHWDLVLNVNLKGPFFSARR